MDTQDPYLWLELDDSRCFQTDRQILESAVDLSQSCLTSNQNVSFGSTGEIQRCIFVYVMK